MQDNDTGSTTVTETVDNLRVSLGDAIALTLGEGGNGSEDNCPRTG
jgi:hypothetical protein